MKIQTLIQLIQSDQFYKKDWKISEGHQITALPYASQISDSDTSARVHFNKKSGSYSVIPCMEFLPLNTPVFA
jgi:hypothetical protein